MQQQPMNFRRSIGEKFESAVRQANQLKNIKSLPVKRWQESSIIKTLLQGLRGQ